MIQTHHISYDPEWKVNVWKGEHWLLTWMNRRGRVSHGFLTGLKDFIIKWEHRAEHLKKEVKPK